MDNFIVSARKYRPVTFNTVIGQKSITNTLKNAIKNKQLAQAFLFCGPRGVGKTTCARILAKTINCENLNEAGEPCNVCPSCLSFNSSASFNIHELDAASNNSVEDIRSLVEQVRIPPQVGKYKVYIIDEVHMLSQAAFNAFLKTLEEPPAYAKFILATTEKHKILPTILSRCQIFDFRRLSIESIVQQLQYVVEHEKVNAHPDALHVIAQKADGAMRDALSIFDQLVSSTGNNLTYETVIENLNVLDYDYYFQLTNFALQGDITNSLLKLNDIIESGFEGQHFLVGLGEHFRNLLVCKDEATVKLLEVSSGLRQRYLEQSRLCSIHFLLSALDLTNKCDINYKNSNNKRLSLELLLLHLSYLSSPSQNKETVQQEVYVAKTLPKVAVKTNSTPPSAPAAPPEQTPKPNLMATAMPSTGISISSLSKATEENTAPTAEEIKKDYGQQQPVSSSGLETVWIKMAKTYEEDNPNFFSTLTKRKPVLRDNNIIDLVLDNSVQQEEVFLRKSDILGFLHKELNNNTLQIETQITKTEESTKPYTPVEKFKTMAEKNPMLLKFKDELHLELDF